jgi:hypothetical protein
MKSLALLYVLYVVRQMKLGWRHVSVEISSCLKVILKLMDMIFGAGYKISYHASAHSSFRNRFQRDKSVVIPSTSNRIYLS